MSSLNVEELKTVGGPEDVDLNDPHVRDIGDWAVREYNKEKGTSLRFLQVLSGQQQVVSGMMYYLVLLVADGANNHQAYKTKVWEQVWVPYRELMSFEPLPKD